ncbi:MAG TPA: alcohol dehydrogenase catalytic domain-containing protein, partial [Candidatus Dormibacteraeota bacterium]|nr:alcohol dehydrogenase catalytic domain-containing protein [Candidatus Dormibacteraeota bacterium]
GARRRLAQRRRRRGAATLMRAVLKAAPERGFRIGEVPEPVAGAGEAVVRVEAASLCGTDLHLHDWNPWAASRVHPPRVMGHEMGGVVESVGAGASDGVTPGMRVAVESHIVCGHCPECRRGDFHVCANTRILGVDVDGVFAPRVRVPVRNVWPIGPDIPFELAALMEPFGNAVHCCSNGSLRGQVVGVFGCGPIGCAAVAIARAENAARIVAVDRNRYRLGLAERMGADAVVDASGGDAEAELARAARGALDVALEMSGAEQSVVTACRLVRPGGWISLLGIGDRPATLDLSTDVVMKGLTLYGVTGRRLFSTWERTTAYLTSGRVDPTPLLTHHFALPEVDAAIELMRSGECGKVVLTPAR